MEGWSIVALSDICNKITTGKVDANAMTDGGNYRFYTCAKDYYFIDEFAFDLEALLISGNGANVGYIHYYQGKFNAYQRTYVLSDFKCDVHFLKYYLELFLPIRIDKEKNDSNTPFIKMDTLTEMTLKIPTLYQRQQKIATILSTVDNCINQTEQLIAKYKNIKQGLMHDLLTYGIDENGTIRNPQTHTFVEKKGMIVPEEWVAVEINDVATIGNGCDYKHLKEGTIPVLGTGGYMTSVNDYLYDGETVCIGRKGTIDFPQYHTGKIWTVDTLFYTHSFKDILPKLLFFIFQTINWKKYNEATGVPSLSKKTISKIKISIPTKIDEQQKIISIIEQQDKLIESEQTNLAKLQNMKQGLMADLLTGKVRVKTESV